MIECEGARFFQDAVARAPFSCTSNAFRVYEAMRFLCISKLELGN
jgi:hypothetical protein